MNRIVKLIAYILVTVFAIVLILPVGWMTLGAFRADDDFTKLRPEIIPERWVLSNFKLLFEQPMLRWTLNSIFVALAGTLSMTMVTCMAGYAFAKKIKKGGNTIFWILMASIMIPGTATLVPLFVLLKDLRLLDTLAGLIIPASFSIIFIFFYRQYVQDLPSELLDVADIDGAGELQKFFRIIIPLSKPAIMTIMILSFMGSWNSYVWPLMILFTPDKFTLPIGIQQVIYNDQFHRVAGMPNYGLMQAAGLYMFVPMLVVFTLGHKYFVKGLWGGGNKG